jgi:hypothetical protein
MALVQGEEATNIADILRDWYNDLKNQNIILRSFQKSFTHYQKLIHKIETDIREASGKAKLGKGAADMFVRAIASTIPIPIINSLAGDLGASALEAIARRITVFMRTSKKDNCSFERQQNN